MGESNWPCEPLLGVHERRSPLADVLTLSSRLSMLRVRCDEVGHNSSACLRRYGAVAGSRLTMRRLQAHRRGSGCVHESTSLMSSAITATCQIGSLRQQRICLTLHRRLTVRSRQARGASWHIAVYCRASYSVD